MSEAALRALSKETKALIIVSEFEARKMPMFQMRAVLNALVSNDEERKLVVDLIERDLRATGYAAEQIGTFLNDLMQGPPQAAMPEVAQNMQGTRRLRSPFALNFEPSPGGTEVRIPRPPNAAATEPPVAPRPVPGAPPATPAPRLPTPPSGSPRRKTFVFDAAAQSAAVVAPSASPPPGTKAWREEMFFGKAPAGMRPSEGKLHVIVADDDKRIRMIFRLRLEEAGYTVVECENGHEAWERIQKGDVGLAVLDMKMPGLHGLEILSNMQDKQITIPVVVCSAYDQLQDEYVIKTHPRLRYLTKPVAADALVHAVKELLPKQPA